MLNSIRKSDVDRFCFNSKQETRAATRKLCDAEAIFSV